MPKIAYVGGFLPFLDPLHTIKTFSTRFPARFPTSNWPQAFSRKNFLQHFPRTFSRKNFLQDFPTRISHRISCKIFLQEVPARIFPQEFPARFSRKIFPSWILIGWLPITLFQMLNFYQSLLC